MAKDGGGSKKYTLAVVGFLVCAGCGGVCSKKSEVPVERGKDYSVVYYGNKDTSLPTHGNTLAEALKEKGVSLEQIAYVKYIGDGHSGTEGKVAVEEDVSWMWDTMIETAEPYKYWLPSGFRRLEIYLKGDGIPDAVLLVNETDATHLENEDMSYMCRGLEKHAKNMLEGKYKD